MTGSALALPFSEKAFYLQEFRGRTLGFAAAGETLAGAEALAAVLAELAGNATRGLVISEDGSALEKLTGRSPSSSSDPALPGAVWRALGDEPVAAVVVDRELHRTAADVALTLGLTKLVYLEPAGGVVRDDGRRLSFVDLAELRRGLHDPRAPLLAQVERLLDAGFPAVNVCTVAGLADELFSYSGSGTLFTGQRYVEVRRLGLDDFDAAAGLVARGVEEGYLAPRPPGQLDRVLASGFGAFVEGTHLAGIGALLPHPSGRSGEVASLYTLTRFVGEGIGGHIVRFALAEAGRCDMDEVFACTTSDRVATFFERCGFARVPPDALPDEKWQHYDPDRKARLLCLRTPVVQTAQDERDGSSAGAG